MTPLTPNVLLYPIVKIPMRMLDYRWSEPDSKRFSVEKSKTWMDYYQRWERCLVDPNWTPATWQEGYLRDTYASVCKEVGDDITKSGLINPLHVGLRWAEYDDEQYAVLRGNMRLSILRARGYNGLVKCRKALPEDGWHDFTESYLAAPYDADVDYVALKQKFEP